MLVLAASYMRRAGTEEISCGNARRASLEEWVVHLRTFSCQEGPYPAQNPLTL